MKQKLFIPFCLLLLVSFFSCEKANYQSLTDFSVRLSTTTFDAEELNLEITKVQVLYTDDTSWITLNAPSAVYNLIQLQGGLDTAIAGGTLAATSIVQKLRLVIGSNNNLKMSGKTFPLTSTSAETVITLDVNKKLNRRTETVNVVFDPSLSISQTAEGAFQFNPVVTLKK